MQFTAPCERGAGFRRKTRFRKTAAINRLHEHYSPDPTLSIDLQQGRRGILDHALHNHDLRERDWNRRPDAKLSRHVRKFISPKKRRAKRWRGASGWNSCGISPLAQAMMRTNAKRFSATLILNHSERSRTPFDNEPSSSRAHFAGGPPRPLAAGKARSPAMVAGSLSQVPGLS